MYLCLNFTKEWPVDLIVWWLQLHAFKHKIFIYYNHVIFFQCYWRIYMHALISSSFCYLFYCYYLFFNWWIIIKSQDVTLRYLHFHYSWQVLFARYWLNKFIIIIFGILFPWRKKMHAMVIGFCGGIVFFYFIQNKLHIV